jgi:pimeloyl-ACP methyl ester carboxylesterase
MTESAYSPVKGSRLVRCPIRGLDYSIRVWGPDSAPAVVLLHGILDTSATFQFLVDAFRKEWRILAPDWRGHGRTQRPRENGWFHEYVADLDALLEAFLPDQAVNLVGHSLGGNIASVYAGISPSRVRRLVSIDAFGMIDSPASNVPKRLQVWLESARHESRPRQYASIEQMAERLCRSNARLAWDKALYLAEASSSPSPDGNRTWLFDVARPRSVQSLCRLDDWFACWREISAPALWVGASEPLPGSARSHPDAFERIRQQIGEDRIVYIANTGHHIQHDASTELARIVEDFIDRDGAASDG